MMAMVWLKEALGYTDIHMVPVHCHNFGKELVDFKHRVAMCKMLAKKVKGVKVNEIEKELSHPNTTYNLVRWYENKYNRGFWSNPNSPYRFDLVIGSDIIPQLKDWDNWNMLKHDLNNIIVLERPGYNTANLMPEFSGPIVFKNLFDYYAVGITSISSSEVREQMKKGNDIKHLVGYDVAEYIKTNRLYK